MPRGKTLTGKKRRRKRPATPAHNVQTQCPNNPLVGSEMRMVAFVERAVQLKRENYFHHEIAEMIAKEFKLESVPAQNTVAYWLKKSYGEATDGIKELQWQEKMDDLKRLNEAIAKWFPIATADVLEIRRWQMIQGFRQPVLDEERVEEQIKATNALVRLIERKARILGYDAEDAKADDGQMTLKELQLWMVSKVANEYKQENGRIIEMENQAGEVLELKSGLEEELKESMMDEGI